MRRVVALLARTVMRKVKERDAGCDSTRCKDPKKTDIFSTNSLSFYYMENDKLAIDCERECALK